MKFAAYSWLWTLLLLPVLYFVLLLAERRRLNAFGRFAQSALWKKIAPEMNPKGRISRVRLWLAALFFIILALARPQWGTHEETAHITGLDIMIAVDLSQSMETEDIAPNRLKKAKHLVKTLSERLQGDRIGIIAFAGSSYVASPLTNDFEYIQDTLDILSPKSISNQGTDIAGALESSKKALDRGAEDADTPPAPSGQKDSEFPSRAVILITDGEDHEGGVEEIAAQIKNSEIRLYVIGVGSQKGGPIPVRDENGNLTGYKKDRQGQPIVSALQPDMLMQVASSAGGKYWNATTEEIEIEEILQDLNALNRTEYAERRFLVFEDRFQYPLFIAVILLFFELSVPTRRRASALPVLAALGLLVNLAGAPPAQAAVPLDSWLENEKGLKSFQEGKNDEARMHFGAAQAKDPTRAELEFNQGTVHLQEEKLDEAIRSFEAATQDPKIQDQAFYNLGGALTKKGDLSSAMRAYLGAIEAARRNQNASLEEDARKNLELLTQEKEKQKQKKQDQKQEKEKQEKQKQEKEKQDQQKQDQQNEEEKKQAEQKNQQKQYEKKEFRSLKLSREDAERVMAELKNREKELNQRQKKRHDGNRGAQKDW